MDTVDTVDSADSADSADSTTRTSLARRYGEVAQVRRRDGTPAEFLWRGRLYVVRAVLAHWLEAGRWWRTAPVVAALAGDAVSAAAVPVDLDDGERETWRVEAGAGRAAGVGVYDLCFDWFSGEWTVARVLD